jgi:hypothetical protein
MEYHDKHHLFNCAVFAITHTSSASFAVSLANCSHQANAVSLQASKLNHKKFLKLHYRPNACYQQNTSSMKTALEADLPTGHAYIPERKRKKRQQTLSGNRKILEP